MQHRSDFHMEKTPRTKKFHIGVEIEMISKLNESKLTDLLFEAGLGKKVQISYDGSIRTTGEYSYSYELKVLSSIDDIYTVINKVCNVIKPYSTANASCGLHVHLDMRHRNLNKAYKNLYMAQPILYSMVPKSRARSIYCKMLKDFVPVKDLMDKCDRYLGINPTAYEGLKTLEVRLHSGTVDGDKINKWIKILMSIIDQKSRPQKDVTLLKNMRQFNKMFKLDAPLKQYVTARRRMFKE